MAECMGKEAEMTEEIRLKLPNRRRIKDAWKHLRESSAVFADERDRWSFCISKVLYPDSLFFLGLNPSEPRGVSSECFGLDELKAYKKIFEPLRMIAAELQLKYSYFDLFCVRRTKPKELQNKLRQLLQTAEGRAVASGMLELAREAIATARPKGIYVCNATVRNTLRGLGPLAKCLNEAGLPPLLTIKKPLPHFCRAGGKNWRFYYTVTCLDAKPVPVLLGIDVGNQRITAEVRKEILKHIFTTFNDARRGPKDYYDTLAKAEEKHRP